MPFMGSQHLLRAALCVAALIGTSFGAQRLAKDTTDSSAESYKPDWQSLSRHIEAPQWFRDAKLGIYATWGVYSVPEKFSEWYPRFMFEEGTEPYRYHVQKYGDPAEFPYHKFVPLFTAERFNAAEWADVYKSSGARFGGLVAEHHDGFAMWDSKLTPWNAASRGPQKDVLGQLAEELRKRDMKFIATFHHARNFQRNAGDGSVQNAEDSYDSHYVYDRRFATSSNDPELQMLYGNMPADKFYGLWLGLLDEVINNYAPDIIYFDSWLNLIPETERRQFCTTYLNNASQHDQQVVITFKQNDLPLEVGVLDIEQGGRMEIGERPWMTDDTVTYDSWSYTVDDRVKPTSMVLHSLIDIVSKNGNLLLNIAPRADGSIPDEQRRVLAEMGAWLKVYGQAIFATRPWLVYGYGPTVPKPGNHGGMSTINQYTPEDYRFTQSKDGKNVYIIVLGKPKAGSNLRMKCFAPHRYPLPAAVATVVELASGKEAKWEQFDNAAVLHFPDVQYNEIANVFQIELKGF